DSRSPRPVEARRRYAFYAHLQPGSLRVKVRDKVRTGQALGLAGHVRERVQSTSSLSCPQWSIAELQRWSALRLPGVSSRVVPWLTRQGLGGWTCACLSEIRCLPFLSATL